MKKIIVLFSILSVIESCTQNDDTQRLQAREDIKKAKDLLTQAETQARAGDTDLKKYEEATTFLSAALEKNNRAADAYALRGWARFKTKQTEEALKDYNKSLEIDPNTVPALNGRAALYESQNKYEEALADYSKAIQILGLDPAPLNNRGILKRKMGKPQEAIEDFTKAIDLNGQEIGRAHV